MYQVFLHHPSQGAVDLRVNLKFGVGDVSRCISEKNSMVRKSEGYNWSGVIIPTALGKILCEPFLSWSLFISNHYIN